MGSAESSNAALGAAIRQRSEPLDALHTDTIRAEPCEQPGRSQQWVSSPRAALQDFPQLLIEVLTPSPLPRRPGATPLPPAGGVPEQSGVRWVPTPQPRAPGTAGPHRAPRTAGPSSGCPYTAPAAGQERGTAPAAPRATGAQPRPQVRCKGTACPSLTAAALHRGHGPAACPGRRALPAAGRGSHRAPGAHPLAGDRKSASSSSAAANMASDRRGGDGREAAALHGPAAPARGGAGPGGNVRGGGAPVAPWRGRTGRGRGLTRPRGGAWVTRHGRGLHGHVIRGGA